MEYLVPRQSLEDRLLDLDRDLKLMALAVLLFALGLGLYLRLLSTYALELGASGFHIGLMNATMLLMIMVSAAPGAWAARRFRLKPVIIAVWWIAALAPICFFLAPSWPWLFPGYAVSGLAFANNPAMKSYVNLKSEPHRAGRNFALLYGMFPIGLVVAPLAGGFIAEHIGMRLVFAASTLLLVCSSVGISYIHDTPYHTADTPWTLASLWRQRRFRRSIVFFFVGFFAVYTAQDFFNPYLAQVHGQSFLRLGIYASLTALGTAVLTLLFGRFADTRGPRFSLGGALLALAVACLLLLTGFNAAMWGVAAFAFGGLDALRYVANGLIGASFKGVPLAWGYAIFDTAMGIPMVLGAIIGGTLFKAHAALPFVAVGVIAVALLALLLGTGKTEDERSPSGA